MNEWNERFTFRPMSRKDFPAMSQWLKQAHNAQWWADDPSDHGLELQYGDAIDGRESSSCYLVEMDGIDFGFVQTYLLDDYPEYKDEINPIIPVPAHTVSMDYLIGMADNTRKGLGTQMLRAFVSKIWDDFPGALHILVPTHQENEASGRVLEKIGFHLAAEGNLTPDNPEHSHQHSIWILERPGAGLRF